jgi:hypothetical protein
VSADTFPGDAPGDDVAAPLLAAGGTLPAPPAEAAQGLRLAQVPVMAVPVGSETRLPDVDLVSLDGPTVGVAGKPVRVPFTISSSLATERVVPVTVRVSNGETLRKDVRLPAMGSVTDWIYWTPTAVGGSLAFVGLLAAIVQGGLARFIVPKLGEALSVKTGLTLVVVSYVGYAFANQGWMMFLPLLIGCFGGIAQPAIQAIVAHRVPANEQGAVQGTFQSLMSVSGIIGPLLGTSVFALFIGPSAPFVLPGAPFLVSAMLASMALVSVTRTLRHLPARPAAATTA